ncbi:hypothetical protein MS6204_03265 [Escherichia coli]|nr:hypothetical protein [Escherichia coli]
MKTELTLNVLQTMSAQEYEDIRAAGSDERRELTHAVMRELDAPDNWTMNGEYGSEFGGFFPVQVRFTPAHERFHLALCSPGDVSQVWVLVLVNAGGEPFAVVQVQRAVCTGSRQLIHWHWRRHWTRRGTASVTSSIS